MMKKINWQNKKRKTLKRIFFKERKKISKKMKNMRIVKLPYLWLVSNMQVQSQSINQKKRKKLMRKNWRRRMRRKRKVMSRKSLKRRNYNPLFLKLKRKSKKRSKRRKRKKSSRSKKKRRVEVKRSKKSKKLFQRK